MPFSIAANAGDPEVRSFLLLRMVLPSATVYYTDCDHPIVVAAPGGGGVQRWIPRAFTVQGVASRQAQQPSVSIYIDNADNTLSAVAFAASNPLGSAVSVFEAWFDPTNASAIPDEVGTLSRGRISGITPGGNGGSAEIRLAAPVDLETKTLPYRALTVGCSVKFKGPECGYAGGNTTCDHTYAGGCTTNSNTGRYGGFIPLPSVQA